MLGRSAKARLAFLRRIFPVVTVIGPRQCGKTALVRGELPKWRCLDLEKPRDWNILTADSEGFFADNPSRVINDESQRDPPLFPLLRHVVDQDRRPVRLQVSDNRRAQSRGAHGPRRSMRKEFLAHARLMLRSSS